ncbi:hypothetical protein A9G45_00440 [Gilliamella sp. HK2]|uniref:hypothetical protein n=1 Tax=unclassified Gilliamella TaxID=2685620 RepID=UPI00080DEDAB|nr:hypothetical protein [Gilliamella apicola]OCG31332.1 hypothetical protein A9G46_10745 [Gilliamella apicola]OCG32789.1 hypothetical protein A9G45_00440 [Gilliamella apicola]OCG76878.1 hypothetical protein A9G42_06090 [Gilliamella apicola]
MKSLKALADAIAETYVNEMIAKQGNAVFTFVNDGDTYTGTITKEQLSSGLVELALFCTENGRKSDPFHFIEDMINFYSKPWHITDWGNRAIKIYTEQSLLQTPTRVYH